MNLGEQLLRERILASARRLPWSTVANFAALVALIVFTLTVGVAVPVVVWLAVRPGNPTLARDLFTLIAAGWLFLAAVVTHALESSAGEGSDDNDH